MRVSEYIQLLRAGYTKAEIDAIVAEEKNPPPQPEPEPEPQPEPEPEPQPEPEPENPPAWAAALAQSIEHLQSTMQAFNRTSLEQPEDNPMGDVDKALAAYLQGPEKR